MFLSISNARGLLGLAELAIAILAFGIHLFSAWTLLPLPLVFVGLVAWHSRVQRQQLQAARAIGYCERALSRTENRWIGSGNRGERYLDPEHVYAADLDLFGKGSLFELLADARTAAGEELLAQWLLEPADPSEALCRQEAVRELCEHWLLREDLALLGADVQSEVRVASLAAWSALPPVRFPSLLRPIALLLGLAGGAAVVAFLTQQVPLLGLAAILGVNAAVHYGFRGQVARVLEGAESARRGLRVLALTLERFQAEPLQSKRLADLLARLHSEREPAAQRILRLQRWMDWMDSGEHVLLRALKPVLLWELQVAIGIEGWRAESGQHLVQWLAAVAELEALSCLSALAFDHPAWCFPAVLSASDAVFLARKMVHPLLPAESAVANDLEFPLPLRSYIVSGSNMSGKSTLLRAAGLNTVLALAGGPVAASALTVSKLQVGASIRVLDSLLDHRSRFLAEIRRLKQVITLAESGGVLFLLDEILSGTNSKDRRIGAGVILRKLLRTGAAGLTTTHDLALSELGEELSGTVANLHFDDSVMNGEMIFDYRLKPGVATRSNALELMRAIGIEV